MTDGQSRAYFERRAAQEQAAAQQAASEPAAQRHREMAEQYRRLVLASEGGAGLVETPNAKVRPKELRLVP